MAQKFHTDSRILIFILNSNFPTKFHPKIFPPNSKFPKANFKNLQNSRIAPKIIKKIKKFAGTNKQKKTLIINLYLSQFTTP